MKEKLKSNELEALRVIRNSLMHTGSFPSVRELMKKLDYKSPRSAQLLLEQLTEKKTLHRKPDGNYQLLEIGTDETTRAQTVDVPLLGTIACGLPILAQENINAMIPVSIKFARPPHKYFMLLAKGDSMNKKGINNGDMVLIKQQSSANNGDIIVALIDDEATIKEFRKGSDSILLIPRSTNSKHQPIILTQDFKVQGVVITSIPKIK